MENNQTEDKIISNVITGFNDDNYQSKPKKVDDRIKNIQDSRAKISEAGGHKVKAPPNSRQ